MRRFCPVRSALLLLLTLAALPAFAANDYKLGPDSQVQPGVPRGEVTHYTWTSKVFPGTVRDYWVYVPKQYDPAKPACVMIFQDGGGFQDVNGQYRVPVVFDNLIHKKEMPVTVAIMINPGVVPAESDKALPRFNRSYEYDAPTDQYARFLLEEILPEVGKKLNLTGDPNGRALCGASSGGICAFTAAWERPDQFRRVISYIGSFTNLRGGHAYPSLIRKYEPRPIRVFMQDGSNDQDIYSGSWFIGNNDVAAALRFGRYDMQYVVGDGGHDGRQGGAILPDALRWLWRDYPAPITTPASTPQPVMEVAQPGEDWQPVGKDLTEIGGIAADTAGTVYVADTRRNALVKIGADGSLTTFKENTGGVTGLAFGPDGRLYACQPARKRIVAYDASGKESVVAGGLAAGHLVVNHKGEVYATETKTGKIWFVGKDGKKRAVGEPVPGATGVMLTPDQSLLLVTQDAPGKYGFSFHVTADGSLIHGQPYFDLYIPYGEGVSGAEGLATDTQGRLYVASLGGIQICDQAGRVIGILSPPNRQPTRYLVFGGPEQNTLYAASGSALYRRKVKTKGVAPFQEPIKPPFPRL